MFRTKDRILLAKEESTYGSDPTPTVGSNAVETIGIGVNYAGDVLERNLQKGTLSPDIPKLGQRWIEVDFTCEVKWSGTKGTAGRLADLIEACGFDEVASAGSSVTYTPASGTMKSVTIYVYDLQDSGLARLHKIVGARGNLSMELEAGQIAKFIFKFFGLYTAPSDVSAPSTPTFDSTTPPIVESSSLTLNAVSSLIAQKVGVDMNNDIVKQDDINSSAGLKGFIITGRKPSGTLNPEKVTQTVYNYATDWLAQTARELSVVVGSADGNKLTVSAPKLSIDKLGEADRNGIGVDDLPFRLTRSSGNDEIQLKFE